MTEKLLASFAKLNLCLEVGLLRSDSYHEIESVLTTISLKDDVIVKKALGKISVRCDSESVPVDKTNIAWKAARLFLEKFSLKGGVEIEIRKKIPVGSGMGGGSSNAAAVLKGMAELWGLNLSRQMLLGLSALLGSDVPFFVEGGVAIARGRGEKLSRLAGLPEMWFALVNPGFAVSTSWAYGEAEKIGLTRNAGCNNMLLIGIEHGDIGLIARCIHNSLEDVVVRNYPIVGHLKELMISLGALGSAMSGSGPTIFGVFKTQESAEEAVDKLTALGLSGWVAKPV
ncbi:MAG: 4-(cytidine 5'-diphospho)-2-C-methyl-D-erythritol kinase [Candidatus Eisenbacteria bacterium]|nr:4-(cytidine 5'-diphospho)-2-C-methyl-D-erythritol kinase [Candidatus Eisenbacteria bacterium]